MHPERLGVHPSAEELRRLLLGDLPELDLERLAGHVESCPDCGERLSSQQPADPLVAALRRPMQPEDHAGEAACRAALARLSDAITPGAYAPPSTVAEARAGADPRSPTDSGDGLSTGDVDLFADRLPCPFGRYLVQRRLGRGGMGAVYLAQDTTLDRAVALKLSRFRSGEEAASERFLREARAAAGLHHEGVCRVLDCGVIDGTYFIAMDYVEGESLARRLAPGAAQGARWSADLVRQVALALAAVHERGIIHRDMKPANVMLRTDGRPCVVDFGLARREQDLTLTRAGTILGTPAYMSPEQVSGEAAVTQATDVYSLGVILYQLLTGQLPFKGENLTQLTYQIVHARLTPPSEHRPDLDPALEEVCLAAMARAPVDRYPTMAAFAEALDQYLCGTPQPGAVKSRGARRPKRRPRRLAAAVRGQWWLVFFLLLLAVALPSALLLRRGSRGAGIGLDWVGVGAPDERPVGARPADGIPPSAAGQAPPRSFPPLALDKPQPSRNAVYQYVLKSLACLVARPTDAGPVGTATLVDRDNRLLLTSYEAVRARLDYIVLFPSYQEDGRLTTARDACLAHAARADAIRARVIAQDRPHNLALLQLDHVPDGADALPLARSEPGAGEEVHAVGNPGDADSLWVYSAGQVRQVHGRKWVVEDEGLKLDLDARVVETAAGVDLGDSGGPCVNGRGELVGVAPGGSRPQGAGSLFIARSEAVDFIDRAFQVLPTLGAGQRAGSSAARQQVLVRPTAAQGYQVYHATYGVPMHMGSQTLSSIPASRTSTIGQVILYERSNPYSQSPYHAYGSPYAPASPTGPARMTYHTLGPRTIYHTTVGQKAWSPSSRPGLSAAAVNTGALQSSIRKLLDADEAVRAEGARGLIRIGPDARLAQQQLLAMLEDPSALVRGLVVDALRHSGQPSPDELANLLPALRSRYPEPRSYALEVMTQLADQIRPAGAAPDVLRLLSDPDAGVRLRAVRALTRLAGSVKETEARPALEKALSDGDARVRVAAAEAYLALVPPVKADVTALAGLLRKPQSELRVQAALALARLGAKGKPATPDLLEALREGDANVCRACLAALGAVGVEPKALVPELRRRLDDKDVDVRLAALEAVSLTGPAGRELVPAIASGLTDRSEKVRLAAAGALSEMGAESTPAVDTLLKALADDGAVAVRARAAEALGEMHDAAAGKVAPALGHALTTDPSREVRQAAVTALGRLGPRASLALDPLVQALGDQSARAPTRAAAAEILGSLGTDGRRAAPALGEALRKDPENSVRLAALVALGRIGAGASAEAPAVVSVLGSDQRAELRVAAAAALPALAAPSRETVAALSRALGDGDAAVVVAAARALRGICDEDQGKSVPDLRPALQGVNEPLRAALARAQDAGTRIALCDAFAALGKDAEPAAALLARQTNDPNAAVRLAAAVARWRARDDLDAVLPVVRPLLRDKDPAIRADAAYRLRTITASASDQEKAKLAELPGDLAEALDDADPAVRVFAASALWPLRDASKKSDAWRRVVPTLIEVAEGPNEEDVRAQAVEALLDPALLPHARLAYPVLLRLSINDHSDAIRLLSRGAAPQLKPTDGAADVSVLTERLGDKSSRWRALAAECLGIARPRADRAAVNKLIELVNNDPELAPRRAAAAALGAIGPSTAESAEALIKALAHRDADLRTAAATALGQIGAGGGEKSPIFAALKARYLDKAEEEVVRRAARAALKKIEPAMVGD
jgi:HEAT repeat protein/S1-C subfamily serine protease